MKKFLFLVFGLFCLAAITGCSNGTEDEKPPIIETEKVEVTFDTLGGSSIAKVEVTKGEKVSKPADPVKKGFVFGGWYKVKECTGTPFDFETEIQEALTLYAKWTEQTTPKDEAVSIEITTQPTKLNYIEGEKFDPTGMVVEATLKNNSKKVITDYVVMPNPGQEVSLGLELFSVTYGELEAFGSITVVAKEIVSVEIETQPVKVSYKNYESFDPSGLVLKVSYNNGKDELVSTGFTYSREMLYNAPTISTVVYQGIEVDVPISVEKIPHYGVPNQKESVYVDAKAIYDKLGLTQDSNRIEASTTFGDIEVVASPGRVMQWEGVGNEKYKYEYFDHSFEGLLKFAGATSPEGRYIVIRPTEDGRFYFWASCPASAQTSFYIYDNYTEATLPEEAKKVIPLVNEGVEDSFPVYAGETYYITASANAFVRGMALVYNPTYYEVSEFNIDTTNVCKEFAVGQTFTSEGLAATVKLPDGSTPALKPREFEVEAPDLSTAGVKTVTVKYQDHFAKTYEVTVHELTGIEVTTLPTKNQYFAGEDLDPAGMVVMVHTNNGIQYEIKDYTISKTENLGVGDKIVVSWNDFECELEIEILENPITGIRVHTNPTKTSYRTGEEFDPAGLVLEKVYSNKDPEILADLTGVTFDKTVITATDTKVVASWDIFSCDIEIQVTVVDWFDLDDTVYVNATDILTAMGIVVADAAASGNIVAGSQGDFGCFHFAAINKAFQYERKAETYVYDGYTYTGVFKTGGATGTVDAVDRLISFTPEKNGVLTLYCTSKVANSLVYLLDNAVLPTEDSSTYLAKYAFTGDGSYATVTFEVEKDKTYHLWFTAQTFIRGMNLSYEKVHSVVEELILDTTSAKKAFAANEEFTAEGLQVSVKCENGKTYQLSSEDYSVIAPDMTTPGTKTVQVKFKDVTVKTYDITVS